ncbi:MAG: [protein-PII] uridylyltransferase [Gammaproteobacteria bacterium]|nr:[protein-PII] uridylyltransferase [Gammaproteobacteria bacterium]
MNTCPTSDWLEFDRSLAQTQQPLALFRAQLKSAKESLKKRFDANAPVHELVTERATEVDQLLIRAWQRQFDRDDTRIALVAVGGYGRGELHPASDVDLLILAATQEDITRHAEHIEQFLLFLWDMGLEVGHSTRSLNDCVEQAKADITVVTNLMEARLLVGPSALFHEMKSAVGPNNIWPGLDFFRAKREEQVARHHRFHDTAYNLEPNIKENPGGLRDLQIIGWVVKRHFGAETLRELVDHHFLTEHEYCALMEAQDFLWRIRFGLHSITGRREDRLLFDHQRTLATQFGYEDSDNKLAVEQFMKDYYRTVLELSRLNEMLLNLFEEKILFAGETEPPVTINTRFQSRRGVLEARHNKIFLREPWALLEVFLLMARDPQLRAVRADTIRLIRDHRYLIDAEFRRTPRCHELFVELFRQGTGLTHELRRMNRYGVLAAYVPLFGDIVGQMQHDLFHVYTVDEHTMFVVRNLRRFTVPEFAHEFPLCSRTIHRIEQQEVLTLAGFFHDIGKGRGGNHSQLGAVDAVNFCREHEINEHNTHIIKWLVENHLLMSTTAQRKDISDPDVIAEFSQRVGNQKRLNHLYLLTVADIRATSPSLWNSWKDALLAELFHATSRALRRGLEKPADHRGLVEEIQDTSLAELKKLGMDPATVQTHWRRLKPDYFLRHSANEVVAQTRNILSIKDNSNPLVTVRSDTPRGGSEIFVYMRDDHQLFATITSALERMGLNITDARIITSADHFALDTFLVLEKTGEAIADPARREEVKLGLTNALKTPGDAPSPNVRLTRQQKYFPIETRVLFREDANNHRTEMEVISSDRPGLLARIAKGLVECDIRLQNAKIATFGERAEDIFFLTNNDDQPISTAQQHDLRETLIGLLDDKPQQ